MTLLENIALAAVSAGLMILLSRWLPGPIGPALRGMKFGRVAAWFVGMVVAIAGGRAALQGAPPAVAYTATAIAGAALIIAAVRARLKQGAEGVNDYFLGAVVSYGVAGDESARSAALAAAMVAAPMQRASMVALLNRIPLDLRGDSNVVLIKQRLEALAREITAKDWGIADAARQKGRLGLLDPEYLAALNRADGSVFRRRWPVLFAKLEQGEMPKPPPPAAQRDSGGTSTPAAARLRELDALRNEGLISDDEYRAKRSKILDELWPQR